MLVEGRGMERAARWEVVPLVVTEVVTKVVTMEVAKGVAEERVH